MAAMGSTVSGYIGSGLPAPHHAMVGMMTTHASAAAHHDGGDARAEDVADSEQGRAHVAPDLALPEEGDVHVEHVGDRPGPACDRLEERADTQAQEHVVSPGPARLRRLEHL
jgi:hypothetical protein